MKFILALIFLTLAACKAIAPLELNNEAINRGEVSAVLNSVTLSGTEQLQVTHAINKFKTFAEKWDGFSSIEDSEKIVLFLTEFKEINSEYMSVKVIVLNHWNEYSPEQQATLQKYKLQALDIQTMNTQLLKNEKWLEIVRQARNFAVTALSIAQAVKP